MSSRCTVKKLPCVFPNLAEFYVRRRCCVCAPLMRLVAFFFVWLTAGSFVVPGPVMACTCAAPATAADGLQRSVAVFRGKVTAVHRPLWDRLGVSNSGRHRVTFAVLKQWKGSPVGNMDVITRLTGEACGFPFEANKEYLVYVVSEPEDLQTGICTGTKNISDAVREMKLLDELVAGAEK